MQSVRMHRHAHVQPVLRDRHPIDFQIGPDGELVLLLATSEVAMRASPRTEDGTQAARVDRPYPATALRYDGREVVETPLRDIVVGSPCLQPLPGGAWVVVGASAARGAGGPREKPKAYLPNAQVFDSAGHCTGMLALGHAPTRVQTTRDGAIWVGYSDVGVFSDDGVADVGLARFDVHGRRTWTPPRGRFDVLEIYALNLASDGVWAIVCDGGGRLGVVQVRPDDSVATWTVEQIGGWGVLSDDRRLGIVGGYDRPGNVVTLFEFGRSRSSGDPVLGRPVRARLREPDGRRLPRREFVFARERTLHHIRSADGTWLQVSMNDLDVIRPRLG